VTDTRDYNINYAHEKYEPLASTFGSDFFRIFKTFTFQTFPGMKMRKKMKIFGASFNFFSAEKFIEDLSKNNGDNSVEETLGMRATSSVVGAPSRSGRVHRTKKI
jgi:hypothetical protein